MRLINKPTLLVSTVEMTPKVVGRKTFAYLTSMEKRNLQEQHGEAAFILYDYLMDMVKHRNPDTSVKGLVQVTGWSLNKTRRTRGILVSAGLLITISFASAKGSKLTTTYLGKDLVDLAKAAEDKRSYISTVQSFADTRCISLGKAHEILSKKQDPNYNSEIYMGLSKQYVGCGMPKNAGLIKTLDDIYECFISYNSNKYDDCFDPFIEIKKEA